MNETPTKNQEHIECSVSDAELFLPSFVQTDLESGMYEDIFPFNNSLDDLGPIEFIIENSTDKFLDLANSYLKIKFKILKSDGNTIASEDKVTVINNPIASLFSQVDVSLGGKIISNSTNTYAYRAYLETLLNYGDDAKATQLGMGLFYKDEANHMNELDPDTKTNSGLTSRFEFCKNSQTVTLLGRVHADIFNQGRLLPNSLPLKITLHRQKNAFVLLSAQDNPNYKIKIIDAVFCIRKVMLTPHKFQDIQQRLEKGPALFPINRVELKVHSVAAGLTYVNWNSCISGQLPNRLFIGMVKNTGYTGSYKENPFMFQHYNVSSVAVYVNGKSVPGNPITTNFDSNDYLDGYRSLYTGTGKINRDEGIGISRQEYKDGYTLFGFNLSPGLCQGGHQEAKESGELRISLEFSKALPSSVTIIAYAEFDNQISMYKSREVLKDF